MNHPADTPKTNPNKANFDLSAPLQSQNKPNFKPKQTQFQTRHSLGEGGSNPILPTHRKNGAGRIFLEKYVKNT